MNQDSSIGERLGILMRHYGLNKNSLTVKLGLPSNSVIGRIVNDPDRAPSFDVTREILIKFPGVNARWLMTGVGDMLGRELSTFEKGEVRYFRVNPGDPFPVNDPYFKATAILVVYGYKDCEAAFDVFGESMAPRFKHGDIILCSDYQNKSIIFGESYLLVINGNPIIRIIKGSAKDLTYRLSAENSRYEDYEINVADISHLYLIKGIIRREVF
jgi:hypothetical protein